VVPWVGEPNVDVVLVDTGRVIWLIGCIIWKGEPICNSGVVGEVSELGELGSQLALGIE